MSAFPAWPRRLGEPGAPRRPALLEPAAADAPTKRSAPQRDRRRWLRNARPAQCPCGANVDLLLPNRQVPPRHTPRKRVITRPIQARTYTRAGVFRSTRQVASTWPPPGSPAAQRLRTSRSSKVRSESPDDHTSNVFHPRAPTSRARETRKSPRSHPQGVPKLLPVSSGSTPPESSTPAHEAPFRCLFPVADHGTALSFARPINPSVATNPDGDRPRCRPARPVGRHIPGSPVGT